MKIARLPRTGSGVRPARPRPDGRDHRRRPAAHVHARRLRRRRRRRRCLRPRRCRPRPRLAGRPLGPASPAGTDMTPVRRPTDVPSAADVVALFQRALRQTEPEAADGVLRHAPRSPSQQPRAMAAARTRPAASTPATRRSRRRSERSTRTTPPATSSSRRSTPHWPRLSNRTRRRHRPRRVRRWSSTACRC